MIFDFWPKQNDVETAMQQAETKLTAVVKIADTTNVDDEKFWEDLTKEVSMARDSDDVYTEPSEASDEDLDPTAEDEVYPAELSATCWQLASGKHGRLHVCCSHGLACGRDLRRPIEGRGLVQALAAGRVWSPRCWQALPPAAQQWWTDSDKVE